MCSVSCLQPRPMLRRNTRWTCVDILRVKHWAGPQTAHGRPPGSELHRLGKPGLPSWSHTLGRRQIREDARRAEHGLRQMYRMAATGCGFEMDLQRAQELPE